MEPESVHAFTVTTLEGKEKILSDYRGKLLMMVNTASKCGFTPQYQGLQSLYEKYSSRGFEILGFPANDFLWQEPLDEAGIKNFCSVKYQVTFPMFSKIHVRGKNIHPLYRFLTTRKNFEGRITWNFNKILVDGEGRVIARFGTRTEPLSPEITGTIERVLSGSYSAER